MSKKLVIVESPATCSKIQKFLGSGYIVKASFGHIREFANGLKSIDSNNDFKPTFKITPAKNKYVKYSHLKNC